MAKSLYNVIAAISDIISANDSLKQRTINTNTDDPIVDSQTIIKTGLNLNDIKTATDNQELPIEDIITTYIAEANSEKKDFMSAYKDRSPVVFTEVCICNHDQEVAVKEGWEVAERVESEIESTSKKLNGTCKEAYIYKIQPLGVRKFNNEVGFHAVFRLYWKISF
jgi:hypothetical protein